MTRDFKRPRRRGDQVLRAEELVEDWEHKERVYASDAAGTRIVMYAEKWLELPFADEPSA